MPLGCFVCVTGVSGSGKSTLVEDILQRAPGPAASWGRRRSPAPTTRSSGAAISTRSSRSTSRPSAARRGRIRRPTPGAFDEIRKLFAISKEAKARGYEPGRFSFNVKGGRCEACEGQGTKIIEMHFLPDVYVTCEECKGRRYNSETLEIKFKGKDISEVLEMPIEEALQFFANFPKLQRCLETLDDVGLGYMHTGQASTTLSGGEAQRVKLAAELGKASTGRTMYILDEPTTGLHFADIKKLLSVLNRPGRPGQHGRGHRAQHARDQDRRLGDRSRSRRRRQGRRDRRCGLAGARGAGTRSYTGQYLKSYLAKAGEGPDGGPRK
jgi:excinuclease ABC subunit A